MKQYHSNILAFMVQPPDGHEVYRQRLRNLPSLSQDNLEPLFHHLEADLGDQQTGLVLIHQRLQKGLGFILHLGSADGEHRINRGVPHGGSECHLSGGPKILIRVAQPEQVLGWAALVAIIQ